MTHSIATIGQTCHHASQGHCWGSAVIQLRLKAIHFFTDLLALPKFNFNPQVSDFITWKVKILKDSSRRKGVGTRTVFRISRPHWSCACHLY